MAIYDYLSKSEALSPHQGLDGRLRVLSLRGLFCISRFSTLS